MASYREAKRRVGAEVRRDLDRRVGRDVSARVAQLPPMAREGLVALSAQFHAQLGRAHPKLKSFYALFKHMDLDG